MTKQRRFYLFGYEMGDAASDYELVPNGRNAYVPSTQMGRYSIPLGDSGFIRRYGLPEPEVKPAVTAGVKYEPLDYYGINSVVRLVSNRTKELLCEVASGDFEFIECETKVAHIDTTDPYWMMAVRRCEDWLGDEGSNIEWMRDADPGQARNPYMRAINELRIGELPEGVHAIDIARFGRRPIVDEVIVDEIRRADLTGFRFTPLQEPTEDEWKSYLNFENFSYWNKIKTGREN